MRRISGYFLVEIIISLFLCASISLLLLKQQWLLSKFINGMEEQLFRLNALENQYEKE